MSAYFILMVIAPALAQEVRVTRSGDGTVVVPAAEGEVTVTTRTIGEASVRRVPRRGARIDERKIEDFVRERAKLKDEWT